MQKAKKNPQLIIILAILFVTGLVFASKFNASKSSVSNRVLADEGEDRDEADESDDDEDREDDEDRNEDEDKDDDEKDSVKSQENDEEDDDADEIDDDEDENDDEDEAGEEIKDISELIAKVENKISQVAAQNGSITEFNAALDEVKDLVAQAQAKLASGDKAGAENLIETADDKLENLEESVKLVLGEDDEDDEDENEGAEADDLARFRTRSAKEYKNIVAQFVHKMKGITTLDADNKAGIGSQVRWVAQTQNDSSERVAKLMDKMSERRGFDKFMFGPDYKSLDDVKAEIAKNQVTLEALKQIMNETENVNAKLVLTQQIGLLTKQNLSLQNYVDTAENTPSIFGWMFRIFR